MKKVKSTPIPTKYISRLLIDNTNGVDELVDIGIAWTIYPAQEEPTQEQEALAQEE